MDFQTLQLLIQARQLSSNTDHRLKHLVFGLLAFILIACGPNKETEFYPNGSLKYEVPLKSDKRQGKMTEYYQNGKLSAFSNWDYGRLHGQTEVYYPNGQLELKGYFKDGQKDSLFQSYFENGSLRTKQFWKNGLQEGLQEIYYPSGIIRERGTFIQNHMIEYTEYYDNGKVFSKWVLDSTGNIFDKEIYKENGERDSTAYPQTELLGADTIIIGDFVFLTARLYNTFAPIYRNTTLVLGKSLKRLKSGGAQIQDTLAVIKPGEYFQFLYKHIPETIGTQNIHGQFVSELTGKRFRTVQVIDFKHSYFVKPKEK